MEVEDVAGDAADAAPEQMNSFAHSKLRALCMVKDLNDDVHTLE